MKNRCGGTGVIVRSFFRMGVRVETLITKVKINNIDVFLPADLRTGMFIPMAVLERESRNIVIVDNFGNFLDEGSVESWSFIYGDFMFVSDHNGGLYNGIAIRSLIGCKVKIKHELCDEIGVYRRLYPCKNIR